MRKVWERFGIVLLAGGAAAVLLTLAAIILFLALRGAPALSWEFITAFPRRGMTEGGIFPALVGTAYLVVGTAILAVPLGVGAAVYLSEYARGGTWVRIVRVLSLIHI